MTDTSGPIRERGLRSKAGAVARDDVTGVAALRERGPELLGRARGNQ